MRVRNQFARGRRRVVADPGQACNFRSRRRLRPIPHRRVACLASLVLLGSLLTACGSDESATPTLTWYINPDNGGKGRLADRCAQASNGAYKVEIQVLPNDASSQREQLVR